MRKDERYATARELYKQDGKKKEAKALFKKLAEEYEYSEYSLPRKQWTRSFLSIGAAITQKIAHRAFQAVEEYRKGVRGKPRFKGARGMGSIEDKQPTTIRIKGNEIHYLGLELPLLYDLCDPVHYHGLNSRIKYVRLVRRNFNGKIRYSAQLICEGKPLTKPQHKRQEGIVGLDIGPSTIATVSEKEKVARLQVFADELKVHKKRKHTLEKRAARRLRISNPAAYEASRWEKKDKHWHRKQGKPIKGMRACNRSKSLQKTFDQLADMARRQAAHRKAQHGRLVNEILQLGNHIKTEKLSYKAFQKMFGRSVGLRAPGMFVETLRRKAENAGGKVEEFNTYRTKLSQACKCGRYEKKGLNVRWKKCPCGVEAQRDLYSAYLACFVEKDTLMTDQACKAWSGMDIALRTAMSELKRSSRGHLPSSLGI